MPSRPKTPSKDQPYAAQTALALPQEILSASGTPMGEAAREQPASPGFDELNLVWAHLRGQWSWLVMLRADPRDSAAPIARALCQVGGRVSPYPIQCIEANRIDLDNSWRLISRLGSSAGSGNTWAREPGPPHSSPNWAPPIMKTIVAVESPLTNSLALPLALAADGVVLCVRRRHDRLAAVRETIATVGASRILCCMLID